MRIAILMLAALACTGQEWSKPVEVIAADEVCAVYDAHLAANVLTVRLRLAKGWHSFAMDNTVRANEKLAGRKAIAYDRPTSVAVTGGWTVAGEWKQSPVKDFSKPELRLFSYGFEGEALLQAPVKPAAEAGPARLQIKAQACTDAICRNIDIAVEVPETKGPAVPAPDLIAVRAGASS
jgi:hypothetical protein